MTPRILLTIGLLCLPLAVRAEKPNVLFIAVDDLRAELGCLGHNHILSPNIDRLAERGVLFTRAYCQQAVCNPSRASLLTGLRPETLRIWDLPTHFRQTHPQIVTLPQHFRAAGYYAENIGKIFHNWRQDDYRGDAPSWSIPAVMHYARHSDDRVQADGKTSPDLIKVPKCEMRDVEDSAYFDGRIADRTIAALERLRNSDDPFFLAVGFWKPHAQFNAPKKYWDMYDRTTIRPANNPSPPRNGPKIALHNGQEIRRAFSDRPGGRPTDEEAVALRHGYYAATTYVDAQIGRVIDALDRLQMVENTVIAFWSDHGFHLGEHGLWAKTSNFELDAHVPMIIVAPGHASGSNATPVELLDLYPTLAELCGLSVPDHLEGQSLVPLLRNPSALIDRAAFTQHPRPAYPGGKPPEIMGRSVRTSRYRYTEWRQFETNELVAAELYDHQVDSAENHNVADDPKNKLARTEAQRQLVQTFGM